MKLMTVAQIEARVEEIGALRDNEVAHSLEDQLHQAVLSAIASKRYRGSAAKLAETALETKKLGFVRWYA